ncbi:hypothetical protein ACFFWC_29855 [Plantactinospora siamensis]|uniref:Uncharacterized protein n=1 Tax=Plantactinospora siamensis TaxID=555372 RepID=A0ABV6P1K2_9ACTN
MSKERARRRAARQAELDRQRAVAARRAARRRRTHGVLRRLAPRLPDRRTGRLRRLTRSQRSGITVVAMATPTLVWLLVDDLALRVVLSLVLLLALPVLVALTLDRRT